LVICGTCKEVGEVTTLAKAGPIGDDDPALSAWR
jgi:hypothetical protein